MNPNMSPNPGPPGGEPSLKVIKVGANSPARIAQACDRCRSKKIRCDGITPRCSQCAAVGFECKTSDKLSRRAFPRGYTETLEERVRQLEQENRDLKAACEEKDERLMMLSRYSTGTAHVASPSSRGNDAFYPYDRPPQSFDVHNRAVTGANGQTTYLSGSNGAALFEALKRKSLDMYQKALPAVNDPSIYFQPAGKMAQSDGSRPTQLPDRMVSDRLINSFVQEWLTVFPVMLRQAALGSYQEICNNPAGLGDHQNVAQIFLMFDLGATGVGIHPEWVPTFEAYWQGALMNVVNNNRLETLQSLVLASICCATKRDTEKTANYIRLAVSMAYRLGLHQEPTMPMDIISSELRKRIWWCLYTVDVFVAAILGTPQLINDSEVSVTLPLETDEDHLQSNMNGAMPQNMGVPRVIPAFALFRASRVLSRAIHELYPENSSQEILLPTVYGLMDELEGWRASLPHYNRLSFAQGRPVESTVCAASAILAVVYYFVQSLIIRRVALGSAGVPNDVMTGMMTHADAAKQTISTVSLMEDQGYSFAFCINKKDLLVTCGLAVLFQTLDLKQDGRLIKDNWITLQLINRSLDHMPGGSVEFQRITKYIIPNDPMADESPLVMNGQQQQQQQQQQIQDANQFSAQNLGLAMQLQQDMGTPRGRGQTAQMGQSPYAHLGYSPNPNNAQSPYETQGQFGNVKNEYGQQDSLGASPMIHHANDGSTWDAGYENGLQITSPHGFMGPPDEERKPMSLGAAASSYPVRMDLAAAYQPFTTARHSKRYRSNPQQHAHNISSSPSIGSMVGASPSIGGGGFAVPGLPEVRASRSDLSLSDESIMSYGGYEDMHLVQAHNGHSSSPMRGELEDVRVWSMRGPGY